MFTLTTTIADTMGVVGGVLLFIKFAIHIYIGSLQGDNFHLGRNSGFLALSLMRPIVYEVSGFEKRLKKIGNVIYLIAVVLLIIFLIFENTNSHEAA